jgi:hypothetical protein
MASPLTELSEPTPSRATERSPEGRYGPVTLERFDEQTNDVIERVRFEGRIIGSASSEKDTHIGHPSTAYAPKHVKCSACRWLEVTIYSRRHRASIKEDVFTFDYVIYTVGNSDVPNEVDFIRLYQTTSAFEVIELLTVRRFNRHTSKSDAFIPPQHAQALAQAASVDDDIREAYVNRAVA